MSGGSAANTMCGVASLGGRAAYLGKVSDDELGNVFGHDLRAVGVQFRPGAPEADTPTGRCIIVVTPDAQRTMNTYLGVSSLLQPTDIDEATVAAGKVLYMEGYLYDRPAAKEAFRHAAAVAHAHDRQVSLTLSDSFCVDRHRADFRRLVTDQVDILFGNETSCVRSTRWRHSPKRSPPCATTATSLWSRWARRDARSSPVPKSSPWPPNRSTRCSTPRARATCSPPDSCSATPVSAARRVREAGRDRGR